jgi:aldose 1-epimerase
MAPRSNFHPQNQRGLVAQITNYGAILTELHVPDRNGRAANIVLGFDNLEQYVKGHPGFGATIGRVANRIAKGKFTFDGKDYTLALNNGPNHLHGGIEGFDKFVWKSRPLHCSASEAAVSYHTSAGRCKKDIREFVRHGGLHSDVKEQN